MARWHNKHISTQWGIAILGFFVIVIALLIPYLHQNEIANTHAMYVPIDGSYCQVLAKKMGGLGKCLPSCPASTTTIKGLCSSTQGIRAGNLCCVAYPSLSPIPNQ